MKERTEVTMKTMSNSRMALHHFRESSQRSTRTLEHSSSQTEGVSGRHKSRSKGTQVQLCTTGNKEVPRRKVRAGQGEERSWSHGATQDQLLYQTKRGSGQEVFKRTLRL